MYDMKNAELRKERLRKEGTIQIPMNVDSSRYFVGNIRWMDAVIATPFILFSVLIIYILEKNGNLTTNSFVFSFLPPILVLTLLTIKSKERRNISLVRTMWWNVQFAYRKKFFELTKERKDDVRKDIRSQLGVINISNDCFHTFDDRYVKVIEVSAININTIEKDLILRGYENFLNDLPADLFPLQILQFSRPINLKSYIRWVSEREETDEVKRMILESYVQKTSEIQKSKSMVSKARYIVVSQKIGMNKEKSLKEVHRKSQIVKGFIEDMLSGNNKLSAIVLNNDELFSLIHSSIDYDSAQILNTGRSKYDEIDIPISIGEERFKKAKKEWESEKETVIL